MSELQAAMGLAVLPYIKNIKKDRQRVVKFYSEELKEIQQLKLREGTKWNFAYFPIIFETEEILLKVQKSLLEDNIFPRRYFYPSLNHLPYIESSETPISSSIASRILCLPLYFGMKEIILSRIINIIITSLR